MSSSETLNRAPAVEPAAPRDLRRTGIAPDHWYPVARARDLRPGMVTGVALAGEPIAIYRTSDGTVHALKNRCAHRQVPLHMSVVKDDCLQCGYHGWTYASDGRCVNVPYLDKGRALPNGVRSYPCREEYGLVFVFPGDRTQPGLAAFPEVPRAVDPEYKTRSLDRRVHCHYSFMHENLMDMNHQFLHRRWTCGTSTFPSTASSG